MDTDYGAANEIAVCLDFWFLPVLVLTRPPRFRLAMSEHRNLGPRVIVEQYSVVLYTGHQFVQAREPEPRDSWPGAILLQSHQRVFTCLPKNGARYDVVVSHRQQLPVTCHVPGAAKYILRGTGRPCRMWSASSE